MKRYSVVLAGLIFLSGSILYLGSLSLDRTMIACKDLVFPEDSNAQKPAPQKPKPNA